MEGNSLVWLAIIHSVFLYSAEAIAIISNTILIYLILTERTKIYNDHQRSLLLNCIVDYFCALLNIFVHPQYEMIDGQWIFIVHKPLVYFPKMWQIYLIGFYAFTNCFGITTIPIQFLFRKCLVCNNEKLSIMELLGLAGISLFFSLICLVSFSYSFYVSNGKEFKSQELIDSGMVDSYNGVFHLLNAESKTPSMILINMLIIVLKAAVFASAVYLSYQIYDKLNEMGGMSPKTKKLQSNMNRMLLIQTSLTFVFAIFPGLFMIFFQASQITILGSGTVITIIFTFVPVINPICTLLLVGQFRKRFFRMILTVLPAPGNNNSVVSIKSDDDDEPQHRTSFTIL